MSDNRSDGPGTAPTGMDDFTALPFHYAAWPARRVFRKGQGPAVILLHELPGMIPECVALARRIAGAGFTVYLPLLFGEPNQPLSLPTVLRFALQLCISREFRCFSKHQSSPITDWLRALCRQAHLECGGPGVGVIGMCLTGGFVLAMMADEAVIAPVIAQPSLPFGITPGHRKSLGVSDAELKAARTHAEGGAGPLALRFSGDRISPPERFEVLRETLGGTPEVVEDSPELCWRRGEALETLEINSRPGNPHGISEKAHAVLTIEYRSEPDHPTHRAFDRVITFLQERCRESAPTTHSPDPTLTP